MTTFVFASPGPSLTFLWDVLFDIGEELPDSWCLVGTQLAALHALEHGRPGVRPAAEADVLVDVRSDPTALRRISSFVMTRSFEPDAGPDELLHRFVCKAGRDTIVVDLLAPDTLGSEVDLTTTPPGRAVQVAGGAQALKRAEVVRVKVHERVGQIRRPSLLGAVLIQAAALNRPGDTRGAEFDLAFLLSLMRDAAKLRSDLSAAERDDLRACPMADRRHRGWRSLTDSEADAGHASLRRLAN